MSFGYKLIKCYIYNLGQEKIPLDTSVFFPALVPACGILMEQYGNQNLTFNFIGTFLSTLIVSLSVILDLGGMTHDVEKETKKPDNN